MKLQMLTTNSPEIETIKPTPPLKSLDRLGPSRFQDCMREVTMIQIDHPKRHGMQKNEKYIWENLGSRKKKLLEEAMTNAGFQFLFDLPLENP